MADEAQKVFEFRTGPSDEYTQTFDQIEGYETDPETGQPSQDRPIVRTRPFESRGLIQADDEKHARFLLEMQARELAATRKGVIYEVKEISEVSSS